MVCLVGHAAVDDPQAGPAWRASASKPAVGSQVDGRSDGVPEAAPPPPGPPACLAFPVTGVGQFCEVIRNKASGRKTCRLQLQFRNRQICRRRTAHLRT